MKIIVAGRRYTVKVRTVGQAFGTEASVRIGARQFDSATMPLGFDGAAQRAVFEQVAKVYQSAQFEV